QVQVLVGPQTISRTHKECGFFIMIACYILYSLKLDKFYTGFTQESVEERVIKHNSSSYGVRYTSGTNDWEIFLIIECATISQALKVEKHIKRMKSKKYIRDLKTYPEMVERLKEKGLQ
ncbi:MAG: GIY-YIG nuclease family protein, partial [Chitinophagaceae bacterium]|nr:GIY-YIG nuclease family protein [Chitinophagaceae bacterium]